MVALMLPLLIGLGVWQLQRAAWKEALLAELERSRAAPPVDLGAGPIPGDLAGFRRVALVVECPPQAGTARAGRARDGRPGYALILACEAGGARLSLDAGWSPRPDAGRSTGRPVALSARRVEGVLVPQRRDDGTWLLVAAESLPGLVPSAPPDPASIPNNHRAYAVQWFGFAVILSIIYAAYVRRWRAALAGHEAGR